ncbi:hypothetical protein SNE510_13410 [Streptomyces sp. NE5-10]|nr:hypothetical protein SNE510_13410 [Streptomyces sp. NE5-10]
MTAVPLSEAPDHRGPPGPAASPVTVIPKPWLRNSAAAPSCSLMPFVLLAGSSSLPGFLVSLGYERKRNPPNP